MSRVTATPKARPRRCCGTSWTKEALATSCIALPTPATTHSGADHDDVLDDGGEQQRQAAGGDHPGEQPLPLLRRLAQDEPGADEEAGRDGGGEHAGRERAPPASAAMATASPSGAMTAEALSSPQPSSRRRRGVLRSREKPATASASGSWPPGRPRARAGARPPADEQGRRHGERRGVGEQRPLDVERGHQGAAGDEADQLRALRRGVHEGVGDDVALAGQHVGEQRAARGVERRRQQADEDQHGEHRPQRCPGQREQADERHAQQVADDHHPAAREVVGERRQERAADEPRQVGAGVGRRGGEGRARALQHEQGDGDAGDLVADGAQAVGEQQRPELPVAEHVPVGRAQHGIGPHPTIMTPAAPGGARTLTGRASGAARRTVAAPPP